MQEFLPFALHQFRYRNAGPSADNAGDFFFSHLVPQQRVLVLFLLFCNGFFVFQLFFQLRQTTIFQFGSLVQIVVPFSTLDLSVDLLQFFPQFLHFRNGIFFVFPFCLHGIELVTHLGEFLLYFLQMCLRQFVVLFLEGSFFDLMLHDLPANFVQLCRHGVHFRPNHCTSFVYQVDRLIRQEPVCDISVGQCSRCDQSLILNLNAMKYFIAFFQTTQNGDRVFYSRLVYQNRLETTFQSSIFFNILPVLVQRCSTNAVQFTPCQHRLQQVACVHSTV